MTRARAKRIIREKVIELVCSYARASSDWCPAAEEDWADFLDCLEEILDEEMPK